MCCCCLGFPTLAHPPPEEEARRPGLVFGDKKLGAAGRGSLGQAADKPEDREPPAEDNKRVGVPAGILNRKRRWAGGQSYWEVSNSKRW